MESQNILFLTRTMKLGGTENVILQLCEILKSKVNKIVVCSCGGINVKKLNEMGIHHYTIPDISGKKPKDMLQIYQTLRRIIRDENITVIHSHHRMAALYARFVDPKAVITIANAHNAFYDKKILTRVAYKDTKLIAVGEMVKKNLTDFFGLPSQQVSVIHNAVKPFEGKVELIAAVKKAKDNGYVLIGNIGRLSKQKGIPYFIEAAEIVHHKNPKTKFFIVGDGEDKKHLEDLVHKKKLDNDVIFLGYRSDVQNVMSQMDFIVLSSLWEGLPLTPIEAFSVGKTIVATAVDGTPEIVQDKINGYLVQPRNANDLAERIELLIDDPAKRKSLEIQARERYESEFSFEKLKQEYIRYYEEL